MSAGVCIEWLKETVSLGELLTAEDAAAARGVAASCDPEDAAVIRSLLGVFAMEALPTWPPMPAPRTPAEQRMVDAVLRVAGDPDPRPERSSPVRRAIQAAWDDLEGTAFADRQESRRVMRTASNADRSYVTSLLGARFRGSK